MQVKSLAYFVEDIEATLSTLRTIFDNIIKHPKNDKYCNIKLTDKKFTSNVWQYPDGEELMKLSGWEVEDDHLRLKDDSCVQIVSQLLKSFLSSPAAYRVPFPDDKFQELSKAIKNGDVACIENLLKGSHVSPNGEIYTENRSLNLLHAATSVEQIDIVKLLLTDYSVDPYFTSEDVPLCYTVEIFFYAQQSFILEVLKYCSVPADFKTVQGLSLLHIAIIFNRTNVISFLLEEYSGTDVNATDKKLRTPLHMAYLCRRTEIAQYLIKHDADVLAVDSNRCIPHDYIDGEPDLALFTNQKKLHNFDCSIEEALSVFEFPQ